MPQPNQFEYLDTSEILALQEALQNASLMSGLKKVLGFDERYHAESMRNEALAADPNVHRIVQFAAQSRAAAEFLMTLRTRIQQLTKTQRT